MEVFKDASETEQVDYKKNQRCDDANLHGIDCICDFGVNGNSSVLWASIIGQVPLFAIGIESSLLDCALELRFLAGGACPLKYEVLCLNSTLLLKRFFATLRFYQNDIHKFSTFARSLINPK